MKIFSKKIKQDDRLNAIEKAISELKKENELLHNLINDVNIYAAIGMPHMDKYDKRIMLLIEAKDRGFFKEENYFVPIDGWKDTAYFKHHYSDISYNYRYFEHSDSLRIPAIGVKGNISACSIEIYKNGIWAKNITDK